MQRSHRSVRNRPVRLRGHRGASPRSARISLALPRECFYTPVGVLRARWGSLPRTLGRRAVSFDDLSWFSLAGARAIRPTVAVVGGGASGTLAAIHLLRRPEPLRLVVVEEGRRLGRGVAYGTTGDEHLLNVPAAGMSAYPDDPGHFL